MLGVIDMVFVVRGMQWSKSYIIKKLTIWFQTHNLQIDKPMYESLEILNEDHLKVILTLYT